MKTNFYIDGFNLYYGAAKGRPDLKWLDFGGFCRAFLPRGGELGQINYFTALVDFAESRERQQVYLDALRTIPNLSVFIGQFRTHPWWARLVDPQPDQQGGRLPKNAPSTPLRKSGLPRSAWVLKTEEKGSDVNLATRLVADCYESRFEGAVVVSGDSDLAMPIRVVRDRGCPVWVVSPRGIWSRELTPRPAFHRKVRTAHLAANQLPDPVVTPSGRKISRPATWR